MKENFKYSMFYFLMFRNQLIINYVSRFKETKMRENEIERKHRQSEIEREENQRK